jgi:hypothetical protein
MNQKATSRDGVRLKYTALGAGPRALLLCNGVGTDLYMWLPCFQEVRAWGARACGVRGCCSRVCAGRVAVCVCFLLFPYPRAFCSPATRTCVCVKFPATCLTHSLSLSLTLLLSIYLSPRWSPHAPPFSRTLP